MSPDLLCACFVPPRPKDTLFQLPKTRFRCFGLRDVLLIKFLRPYVPHVLMCDANLTVENSVRTRAGTFPLCS